MLLEISANRVSPPIYGYSMQRVTSMKGAAAALGLVGVLASAAVAQADCAGSIAALQAKLPQVQDAKRREEVRLLLEKATIDQQHGRTSLCEAAVARAANLAK